MSSKFLAVASAAALALGGTASAQQAAPAPVVASGQAVPGGDGVIRFFDRVETTDDGLLFRASVETDDGFVDRVFRLGADGTLSELAGATYNQNGQVAVTGETGIDRRGFVRGLVDGAQGGAFFASTLFADDAAGSNEQLPLFGVFRADADGETLLRTIDPTVATTADAPDVFLTLNPDFAPDVRLNARGDALVQVSTFNEAARTSGPDALLFDGGQGTVVLARGGEAAPGTDGFFASRIGTGLLADGGGYAFGATLTDVAGEPGRFGDSGVFVGSGGSVSLAVRTGDTTNQGEALNDVRLSGLNEQGTLLLSGDAANRGGLFVLTDQGIDRVVGEGDAVEDVASAVISGVTQSALSDDDEVAFVARLDGDEVFTGFDTALFATVDGEVRLVAQEGAMLDDGSGRLARVVGLSLVIDALAEDGQLTFLASFFGGGSGLFTVDARSFQALADGSVTSAVPLPAGAWLFLTACGAGFVGRRSARRT